jgi:integrase
MTGSRVKQWAGRYRVYFRDAESGEERFTQKSVTLGKKSELTKFQAQERLRSLIERDTNERKKAPFDPRVSFRWYVENRYLVNHRSSWRPATQHSMTSELNYYILPEFGDRPLGEIERHDCSLFLEKLVRKYSKAVVLHCKVTTKSVFEDAIEDGFISRNPMRKVKTPVTRKPRKDVLKAEQARLFFSKITNAKHLALMAVASFCAIRASEVFGLSWGAYVGNSILVKSTAWEGKVYESTKTDDSHALVTVPEVIQPWIEVWKGQCLHTASGDLMFPAIRRDKNKQQIPMRPKNFLQDYMKPLAETLGIDPRLITFQVLRRTFGTTMQKHGSMKDVQAHLRHASITTTGNIYVQEIPESVRAAVNATANEILGMNQERKNPKI